MDLGIPELTEAQIEAVSEAAENAARQYIFSKVSQKQVENLTVSVEAEGTKPVSFTVEVDLALQPKADADEKLLADAAVKTAFQAIEKELKRLK